MTWGFCLNSTFAESASNAALVTFLLYTLAVFGLAILSNRLLKSKSFLSEYFLGSRSLGVWAFALTFAATSTSGGSFTGFPSKIYSHGWILALWIGSYMVVPICTMGILGKRINQVARISGSITVPDVIRDRFHSPLFGLLAVSLIVFFMTFNLVAQFKSGSLILKILLDDVEVFKSSASWLGEVREGISFLGIHKVDPAYLLCLLAFGVAVIIYTTYGGFHAVVWTDVMQGIVMLVGVLIMLPLALSQVGGMTNATREMAKMTPPIRRVMKVEFTTVNSETKPFTTNDWLLEENAPSAKPRLFRVAKLRGISEGENEPIEELEVLEITTPSEIERFLADKKQTAQIRRDVRILEVADDTPEKGFGWNRPGVYVTGPGPEPERESGFLPLSLAISFFFMWAISGAGQPSNMVRLMAFNSSQTLRRSIFTVAIYFTLIYFPLVLIFCCARVLLPGMEVDPDSIMPAMAVHLTSQAGVAWLAGLLVAAPFAAVMSTVDSFLLMISSALVRDIYQRNLNPEAEERTIKRLSYFCTLLVGTGAILGAINPPKFLQDIIVYTGSGLAACFLAPMIFALYWPRVNTAGAVCGMLAGFAAHLSMYVAGWFLNGSFFRPYQLFNMDPIIVGLFTSFLTVYFVSKATPPPPEKLVEKYFGRLK